MIVGKAIYNILNSDAAIAAVVGTQIFPELAAADIKAPYIVYSIISNTPSDIKDDGGSVDTASIEVYCFESSYSLAIDLGVLVRAALSRATGSFSGVKIQSINYTNEQMDVNETRLLWAAIQDYSVRIKLS